MITSLVRKIFGTVNERTLKSFQKIVFKINELEEEIKELSDDELKNQTIKLRNILAKNDGDLDLVMPEAFATVREAAKRVLGQRHFDVQLLGGITMHYGMISEMKTGEGKTLTLTLPAYLNALSSKGVHVVTVNDYLAKRDAAWMGKIYEFLGLSVGCITNELNDEERKNAYNCDITYGTNNEFGFDYLRDNMKYSKEHMSQREFNYAIIDEIDSILIDEARTPLVISGPTEDRTDLYETINNLMNSVADEDFDKDEKSKSVTLTEDGMNKIEELLKTKNIIASDSGLYDIDNIRIIHHINQALRAHKLFHKDVDYLVKDNKVYIIDEFTGRIMEGRRYSEGLHQALEAKEKVEIHTENQTLASVTFQNYFRLYPKLAGMTGTAMTEAQEFKDIYKLNVVEIPTNVTVTRIDDDDEIYSSEAEKFTAMINLIKERHEAGQPILVGTVSIEKSEHISTLLTKANIPHNVLNARYHEKEAEIISQAGRFGAVTIATNMAGRGTDIMLGGNPEMLFKQVLKDGDDENKIRQKIQDQVASEKEQVMQAGGLLVIGTERHESRRIDNQLRGRSGRQGDVGRTKFYLSLQDDLMRIFGSDRIAGMLQKLGLKDGEAITHPWISKALEKAQHKVEAHNYDIRKNLLRFDDVMNEQRKAIYKQRLEIIESEDLSEAITDMITEKNAEIVSSYIGSQGYFEQWDLDGLEREIFLYYKTKLPVKEWCKEEGVAEQEILDKLNKETLEIHKQKEDQHSSELIRLVEKRFLLSTLDEIWKDHLHSLDHLKQGIHLRAYGQKDPLNEYKREAFEAFSQMLGRIRESVIQRLFHLEIIKENTDSGLLAKDYEPKRKMSESRADPALNDDLDNSRSGLLNKLNQHINRDVEKVGRNEPCPCGSGKKYKFCYGQI
jgi:preprotein translocase subunit SecA